MTRKARQSAATVYLVGAGPGDAGLITLRGAECLRRADVVLYDYLVNPRILAHARDDAELICLGRHGQGRIMPQQEINRRMVELATQGKTVVRLKGGDPAVFARTAEETEALAAAGIACQVVPGITAALAAGSYAGVPITHRDLSSAVALVTGQEHSGEAAGQPAPNVEHAGELDYSALAAFPGTLVFYMGVTTARRWTAKLIEAGKPPHTPAAIVRRCSLPDQQTLPGTLADVAERIERHGVRPPAIVIVGAVASPAATLDWFTTRPLFGQRIVVTRPRHQADALDDRLTELGAEVLRQPAIEIDDPPDWHPVDAAIERLGEFDWLVFSSVNGVRYFIERLLSRGRDLRHLGGVRLAAVGPGTAAALAGYHLRADAVPPTYRAESLAEQLANEAAGKRMLLVRASRGREVLAQMLAAAGADVRQIVVYTSRDVTAADAEVAELLAAGGIHWITVTSSAIARSLAAMFGESLRRAKLASISPVTSETLRELGHEPAVEATAYTIEGVVAAMLENRLGIEP